jgi:1-acyl-sn-glycerol-3-phosphate acyltransferase
VPCQPVAIVGAAEAMRYGQNWPTRGRLPVYVTYGEPVRAEDGEAVAQFSQRIAKEVSGLVDHAITYRASQA